jgi:hypothetical protein
VRWNSPYINHFLSPDTIIPDQTNPQNWNRYSYVNNNPLRYTDPTGHYACGDGEEHDCNGHKQDPNKNPHPPKPPKPNKEKDKDKKTRDPDYVTLNVGGSIPGLGTIVSGQGALTLDQYGNLYFGLGLALGPEAPLGFSASLSAGWLDTWSNSLTPGNGILDAPTQQESEQRLSGGFVNGTVCIIFCVGLTNSLSNLDNVGFEVLGIGVPQASIGGGYSWLIDLTDRETPIW